MQLIKDLWAVVQAVLAVVKTLVGYVRAVILAVETLIGKIAHKKAEVAVSAPEVSPVVDTPIPTSVAPTPAVPAPVTNENGATITVAQ
jgi:hypothetical protein